MEYKNFLDLTDEDIRQIVTDIFAPEKITCIKRNKHWDEISCKIYTIWGDDEEVIADELILKDPFVYGEDAIQVDFGVRYRDYERLKQFCVSRGIYPHWFRHNPYIKK